MIKEPNLILSPTPGNLYFSVTIYPVYFRFLLCYNDQDERQKYGVIQDSNKKAERFYSPSNVLPVYSFFNSDIKKLLKKKNTNSELLSVFVYYSLMAEKEGFEPSRGLHLLLVFETSLFNHLSISPAFSLYIIKYIFSIN